MFCDKCGATLQADQRFCSRCGKEVAGPLLGFPRRNRVREHVRLLGILWLALSALDGLMAVASYIVANTVFNLGTHPERPAFLHPFLSLYCNGRDRKSFCGICRGLGFAATRTLGAHARCHTRVCFALLQHPLRHRPRHLHALGAAASRVRRRVRERSKKRQRSLSEDCSCGHCHYEQLLTWGRAPRRSCEAKLRSAFSSGMLSGAYEPHHGRPPRDLTLYAASAPI
jgi:hypothetical protein